MAERIPSGVEASLMLRAATARAERAEAAIQRVRELADKLMAYGRRSSPIRVHIAESIIAALDSERDGETTP